MIKTKLLNLFSNPCDELVTFIHLHLKVRDNSLHLYDSNETSQLWNDSTQLKS